MTPVKPVFRLLRGAVALGPESRTAFRSYLVDREPSEAHAKALAAIVGWPPVETKAAADPILGEPADLATALLALTKELEAWRLERADLQRRLADLETEAAMRAAGSTPPDAGPGERTTPDALRDSAG